MQELCIMQVNNSELSIVEKTQASVTSEINSEKEYEIVKILETEEDKLSEDQKNKILIHLNLKEEKSSLYKKYLEKL